MAKLIYGLLMDYERIPQMPSNEATNRRTDNGNRPGEIPERIIKRLSQPTAVIPAGGFKTVKQVLDFAIAREKESYDAYSQLVRLVKKQDVREMLEGFASDELKHAEKLQSVQAGEISLEPELVGSLDIAEKIPSADITADMKYADALTVAMKKEKIAFRLYTKLASLSRTGQIRQMFSSLANEEAKHKLSLEIEYDLATF
jgi:rubrerythrin